MVKKKKSAPAKKKAGKKKAGKKKSGKKKTTKKPESEPKGRKLKQRKTMAQVVKAHTDPTYIVKADDFEYFDRRKIYLGVLDIELFLLPVIGGRTCIIGNEMAGKTVLAKKMTGALQNTCRQCQYPMIEWVNEETGEVKTTCKCGANDPMQGVFIDIEDSFDPLWARRWGVRISDEVKEKKGYNVRGGKKDGLWVVIPTSGDYALDFTVAAVKDGAADFVVLDSIAFILRDADKAKLVGDTHQPMQRAAFIAGWLYKLLAAQIGSKMDYGAPATLIWTNQFYTGMPRNPMADPRQESGGLRVRQVSSNRMKILSAQPERTKEVGPKFKSRYLDVKFGAIKAKARTPHNLGEYRLFLDNFKGKHGKRAIGTADDPDRLVSYFDMIGLFEKRKSSYWCLGRDFKRIRDIIAFLNRPDINYISRYFVMRTFLPTSAQDYLLESDFSWSPFGPDPAFEIFRDLGYEPQGQGETGGSSVEEDEGSEGEGEGAEEALSDDDLF
jgi:RecA/RadA recombinase